MLERIAIGTLVLLACSGCDRLSPTEPSDLLLPKGAWSSTRARLDVDDTAVRLATYECLTGFFPRPAVDAAGAFSVRGTVLYVSGPPPPGPPPPAVFEGELRGDRLVLMIRTDGGAVIGPIEIRRGDLFPPMPPCAP